MTNELDISAPFPIPGRMLDGVNRARHHIASPGARWTGAQRNSIAAVARAANAGDELLASDLSPETSAIAATVAAEAHTVTADMIDNYVAAVDRDVESFVEIVGVVSRQTAIDTFTRGVGAADLAFAPAEPGSPTGQTSRAAKRRSAFVPTVGPAGATSSLSAVATEDLAQEDLHGTLYLSYAEMGDLRIEKGLPRWQLELIAARTSLINHCLF